MRKIYKKDNHAWVGDCQQDATHFAQLPKSDDARWIKGVPKELDKEFLTLSPFYPSKRLDCCVEKKSSNTIFRYPNHEIFSGVVAYMELSDIAWESYK